MGMVFGDISAVILSCWFLYIVCGSRDFTPLRKDYTPSSFRFLYIVASQNVYDVWMNRWVLKKISKDVFDELAEYIKNIKTKITTYVCMSSSCEKEYNR